MKSIRLWGAALLWLAPALPAAADMITIDPMDSAATWMILDDHMAKGSTALATGPNGAKALDFKYDLSSGNWVAWIHEVKNGLKGMRAVAFEYQGTGSANLEIKLTDASGATFGLRIPSGASVATWKKVVISSDDLKYLWGGNTQVLNPDLLRRFEFTLSSDVGGGPGDIKVANLQFSTTAMSSTLPKEAAPVPGAAPAPAPGGGAARPAAGVWPRGTDLEITVEAGWQRFLDQGAALVMSVVEGPNKGKKALQADFQWGQREVKGVTPQTGNWLAIVKSFQYDLSESRDLTFTFKSVGSVANLEIKVKDVTDTVFGHSYPSGASLPNWTSISVPRSDFRYLWGGDGSGKFDWSHVKSLEFTLTRTDDPRNSGTFTVTDIHFTGAVSSVPSVVTAPVPPAMEAGPTGQIKVVIDDFTDLNPANRYYVIPGEDSSLKLLSSRITFDADYSMDMQYTLSSRKPTGSWVEARRQFQPPLDWTGVDSVKIWVKGDGSRNIFRFTLTDGDGNQWVCDNEEVLASTDWYLVEMPVGAFVLFEDLYRKTKSPNFLKTHLQAIRSYGIDIVSQPVRSSNNTGEIWVENLYLVGSAINIARAVPTLEKPPIGIAIPLKNWNIGGTSETKLEDIPSFANTLNQNLLFRLTGNFEKFSVLGEIRLDSTFGNAGDTFRSNDATLTSPNVSVTLLDPLEGFSNVIVGNLWFNSSPHIFANDNLYGGWGFKGLMAEGWVGKLHHRTYYLKHNPDSYSFAGHYAMNVESTDINLIGTYYNQEPFSGPATRLQQDDKALLLDATRRFKVPGAVTIIPHLTGAYDWYQQYWDVATQAPVDVRSGGQFLEGEVNFTELDDIFWPGLSFTGRYRVVSPDYKPTFRQNPGGWDREVGDQKSYDVRVYQTVSGVYASAEYWKLNRISDPNQSSDRTILALGYSNWSSIDVSISQESGKLYYNYIDPRFLWNSLPATLYDNRKEDFTTLNVTYHLSSQTIVKEWLQYRRLLQYDTNDAYTEMTAVTNVQYYPAPNISFNLENKFTRLGRQQDVGVPNLADPYSIANYTRVFVDLTF